MARRSFSYYLRQLGLSTFVAHDRGLRSLGSEEAKKEFLAILSHELRNPLATVLSSVELLKLQEAHTTEASALLITIEEHVHAMTLILDHLLGAPIVSRRTATLPLPLPAPLTPVDVPKRHKAVVPIRRSKHTRTILIVDDNELAATALARLLELRGHTVSIAYNGTDAILQAKSLRPNIIILDIGLPDINGYDVAHTLREDKNFSSTLIAITGYGHLEDRKRAKEVGFYAHLTKPVSVKEVEKVFRTLP
jgi:CheY-like chemotaxis protein